MKHLPSRRTAGLILALVLVAAACSGSSGESANSSLASATAEDLGDPAPTKAFETFDGDVATLAKYEGRPLVLNFWASWCPSCVAEMSAAFLPAQVALGDEVGFLGMNITDERSKALELVEETGVLFDLAEDTNGELYTALGGLGMPFTVFISADGQVLDAHNGPLTEGQLVDKISELLLS
jgi:cytochrome c biogenesis protein CcmG/thiol:disulfide interchange protein DsbE